MLNPDVPLARSTAEIDPAVDNQSASCGLHVSVPRRYHWSPAVFTVPPLVPRRQLIQLYGQARLAADAGASCRFGLGQPSAKSIHMNPAERPSSSQMEFHEGNGTTSPAFRVYHSAPQHRSRVSCIAFFVKMAGSHAWRGKHNLQPRQDPRRVRLTTSRTSLPGR